MKKISEALIGMDLTLQSQIDQVMIDLDKTEKKGDWIKPSVNSLQLWGKAPLEPCLVSI